jgi:hypothetical protein
MIGCIQRLHADFESQVEKRKGHVRTWLLSNCRAAAVSKPATLNQPSGERAANVGRVAIVDPVAPGQRESASDRVDAREFPTADEPVDESVGVAEEAASFAERPELLRNQRHNARWREQFLDRFGPHHAAVSLLTKPLRIARA